MAFSLSYRGEFVVHEDDGGFRFGISDHGLFRYVTDRNGHDWKYDSLDKLKRYTRDYFKEDRIILENDDGLFYIVFRNCHENYAGGKTFETIGAAATFISSSLKKHNSEYVEKMNRVSTKRVRFDSSDSDEESEPMPTPLAKRSRHRAGPSSDVDDNDVMKRLKELNRQSESLLSSVVAEQDTLSKRHERDLVQLEKGHAAQLRDAQDKLRDMENAHRSELDHQVEESQRIQGVLIEREIDLQRQLAVAKQRHACVFCKDTCVGLQRTVKMCKNGHEMHQTCVKGVFCAEPARFSSSFLYCSTCIPPTEQPTEVDMLEIDNKSCKGRHSLDQTYDVDIEGVDEYIVSALKLKRRNIVDRFVAEMESDVREDRPADEHIRRNDTMMLVYNALKSKTLTGAAYSSLIHTLTSSCGEYECKKCSRTFLQPTKSSICAMNNMIENGSILTVYCYDCRPEMKLQFCKLPPVPCSNPRCNILMSWNEECSHLKCSFSEMVDTNVALPNHPCLNGHDVYQYHVPGHTCVICAGVFIKSYRDVEQHGDVRMNVPPGNPILLKPEGLVAFYRYARRNDIHFGIGLDEVRKNPDVENHPNFGGYCGCALREAIGVANCMSNDGELNNNMYLEYLRANAGKDLPEFATEEFAEHVIPASGIDDYVTRRAKESTERFDVVVVDV